MTSISRCVAWVALAAAFLPSVAFSEQRSVVDCVKLGDYKNLDFMRTLKLGAAEFVNPGLFDKAAVAYRYDLPALEASVGRKQVFDYLREGSGALANVSGTKLVVVELAVNDSHQPSIESYQTAFSTTFVSTKAKIGNISPMSKIVSWSATKPVVTFAGACQ